MSGVTRTLVPTCAQYLDDLADGAVGRGITEDIARYCKSQTLRCFGAVRTQPAGRGMQRRLAGYFEAVVREQVKRSRGPALASARRVLVLMTLAEDLANVGASRERMRAELTGVYGPSVASEEVDRVLDAVTHRLAS